MASSAAVDPILPSLRSIRAAFDDNDAPRLRSLLHDCIRDFSDDSRYRHDARLLTIFILYADVTQDFAGVFSVLGQKGICQSQSLLYETFAAFHILRAELLNANNLYLLAACKNAEPLDRLEKTHHMFQKSVLEIVRNNAQHQVPVPEINGARSQKRYLNPYSRNDLLKKMDAQLKKLDGYCRSSNQYSRKGKVLLTSFKDFSEKTIIKLGSNKYQIKGLAGEGAYAQVYKAYIDSNPDNVVALKVQKSNTNVLLWEFYMYRQLDKCISDSCWRSSFGFARELHVFSDSSILICDYLSLGTLQDAINSYLTTNAFMEEVVCMYYTMEMLGMLEALHLSGIMHGDFKADNLIVRHARDELTEDGFRCRTGPWRDQGLCLVDWGKGIDINLFPDTEFCGDCETSSFRCTEMLENRLWTYQADTYALCVNVHMMLYGAYMEVEKKKAPDGSYHYQPKAPLELERSWNVELWKNLFSTLLNIHSNDSDVTLLRNLKNSFEEYMCSDPQRIKSLTVLLAKQKAYLVSA